MDVTIDLGSNDFDTLLALLDPSGQTVADDDDGGPGIDSRIHFTLTAAGSWTIGAINFSPDHLGDYSLEIACSSGGEVTPPLAPSNLTAIPHSTDELLIQWQDNSDNEDAFRIERRAAGESFVDIGSVFINTTAVTIFNLERNTIYDFRVRARNSAGDSAFSNVATAMTAGIFEDGFESGDLTAWLPPARP